MAAVTSVQLGQFLNRPVDALQANSVIQVVTSMARSYTRGAGFTGNVPNDAIAQVVLTAAARLLAHPRQLALDEAVGPESVGFRQGFTGWSVAERYVLDGYRVRAQ